jgi:hypothetical protein
MVSQWDCTGCQKKLGARRFATALVVDDDRETGLRLCEDCGILAQEEYMKNKLKAED